MYGYDVKLLDEITGVELTSCEPEGRRRHRGPVAARLHANSVARRRSVSSTRIGIRCRAGRSTTPSTGASATRTGYYFILGRTDDVINVAGHRLGTREIEESISSHANVAEVAVVGVADALKGQVAMAFVVVKDASALTDANAKLRLEGEIMKRVDEQLGAVARPARVRFVTVLPKTRSGKLLRRAIQAVCERRDPGDLTTIEDPLALQQMPRLGSTPLPANVLMPSAFRYVVSPPVPVGAAARRRGAVPAGPAFPRYASAAALTSACDAGLADAARRRKTLRSTLPTRARLLPGRFNAAIEDASGVIGLLEHSTPTRRSATRRRRAPSAGPSSVTLGQNESLLYGALRKVSRATPSSASSSSSLGGLRGFGRQPGAGRPAACQADERPHLRPQQAIRRAHPRRERQGADGRRRPRRRSRERLRRRSRATTPARYCWASIRRPSSRCSNAPRKPRPASAAAPPAERQAGEANLALLAELAGLRHDYAHLFG